MAKSKDEIREAARVLYFEGWEQNKLADFCNVAPKTIGEWAKEGKWKDRRNRYNLFREDSSEQVMNLIDFQLRVLNKIIEAQNDLIETTNSVTELKALLIKNGELDGLQKLFTTLKGREVEWVDTVRFMREFTDYANQQDSKLAAMLIAMGNKFIELKRTQNQ